MPQLVLNAQIIALVFRERMKISTVHRTIFIPQLLFPLFLDNFVLDYDNSSNR